ncbi:hypothetical protein BJX70DRAFT_137988 [Aspergillus crustosus]
MLVVPAPLEISIGKGWVAIVAVYSMEHSNKSSILIWTRVKQKTRSTLTLRGLRGKRTIHRYVQVSCYFPIRAPALPIFQLVYRPRHGLHLYVVLRTSSLLVKISKVVYVANFVQQNTGAYLHHRDVVLVLFNQYIFGDLFRDVLILCYLCLLWSFLYRIHDVKELGPPCEEGRSVIAIKGSPKIDILCRKRREEHGSFNSYPMPAATNLPKRRLASRAK